MFERSCTPIVVARAFLLADILKNMVSDREKFRAALIEERKKLAAMDAPDVFKQIEPDRRKRIEMGSWVFAVINLDRCAVWPGMGGEEWARGPVSRLASQFPSRAMPGNRTRAIRECTQDIFAELPLILIRTRTDYNRFRIEDGSHRAIAYYLAGFRQAYAYVARVPGTINLTWKWDG